MNLNISLEDIDEYERYFIESDSEEALSKLPLKIIKRGGDVELILKFSSKEDNVLLLYPKNKIEYNTDHNYAFISELKEFFVSSKSMIISNKKSPIKYYIYSENQGNLK